MTTPRPLIADTQLTRWTLGIAATIATLFVGYASTTLQTINTTTTQLKARGDAWESWVTRTDERIEHLDTRLRTVEGELLSRRDIVEEGRKMLEQERRKLRDLLERSSGN